MGHNVMVLAFEDIEKAFDTVPRKMAMATLRWMGAPESEVKMVEAMHENTKARVVVVSGTAKAGTIDEHDIVDGISRNLFIAII